MAHSRFDDALRDALTYIADWDDDAEMDQRMFCLDQWDASDVKSLSEEGRASLVIDQTRPFIQAVAGAENTNRFQTFYVPREYRLDDIDRYASKGASEWARWVQQVGDWENEVSLAFIDNLVMGIGALEMYMAYDDDPDGRIMLRRRPIWEVLWDPSSVQPNLKDRRWDILDKWVDEDELASLFGQAAVDEVIRAAGATEQDPGRGGFWNSLRNVTKTTEQRYAYDLQRPRDQDDKFYEKHLRKVRLFEFNRYERRYQTRMMAPDLDQIEQMFGQADPAMVMQSLAMGNIPMVDTMEDKSKAQGIVSEYEMRTQALNEQLGQPVLPYPTTIEDYPVKYYYRSYHTGVEQLKEEVVPHDGFTNFFLTCFEDWSEGDRRYFFGLMRQMRDPQKLSNKMLSQMQHLYTSNAKGALLAEKGLFRRGLANAARDWNKANTVIEVERGKLSNTPKDPYRQLTSNVNLNNADAILSIAQAAVPASVGLSQAYTVGSVGDLRRTSGEAVQSVMEQNIKTQSAPFDSLRLFRKLSGRALLSFTKEYIDPEQIIKVVGEDDAMFLEAVKSGDLVNEYNVVVDEKPTSVNERKDTFAALIESGILPQLVSQGVPIPPEMAEMFPGPPDVISQLKTAFEKAYEVQVLNLEVTKMQLLMQLQQPAGPPQPGAGPPPQGQPPNGGQQ